jgi:UDP-glucuronate decarboxylase
MDKVYLVAGGCGFIGHHLVKKLTQRGDTVVVVDNLSSGFVSNFNGSAFMYGNIEKITEYDFSHFDKLDGIFNLACVASPDLYQANPIKTLETNFNGVLNLLRKAQKYNCRFLQTSTSEVYGDALEHPQREDYWGNVNCYGPRACYDEGKRVAETLVYEYRNKVETRIARIFNTYGPAMSPGDGRVVSNFICQALRGQDITVYGDGSQTRSFCYVSDMVDGLISLFESDVSEPINLGNPEEFTVIELAEMVIKLVGSNSKIVFKPLPKDDPKQRKPNIEKAKQLLDWQPKIKLDEGLQNSIQYYEKLLVEGAVYV